LTQTERKVGIFLNVPNPEKKIGVFVASIAKFFVVELSWKNIRINQRSAVF